MVFVDKRGGCKGTHLKFEGCHLSASNYNAVSNDYLMNSEMEHYNQVVQGMAIGGCMIGSLVTGIMVSNHSRWNILIILNITIILSSIPLLIPAIIEHIVLFSIAKLFLGVACGGFAVICPIYMNEITPPQYLGGAGATFQTACNIGIVAAITTSLGFPAYPKTGLLLEDDNAIILLIWTSLVPLLFAVIQSSLLLTVYRFDTPKFLKTHGKTKQLERVIGKIYA